MKKRLQRKVAERQAGSSRDGGTLLRASAAARRAYSRLAAADPSYKIVYLIPHGPQDLREASIFCWYTPGIHRAAWPVRQAVTLPADIREPFSSGADVFLHRALGHIHPHILPIQLDALEELGQHVQTSFLVFLTNDREVADSVDSIRSSLPYPTLHASSISGDGRLRPDNLDSMHITRYVQHVLQAMRADPNLAAFRRQALEATRPSDLRRLAKHRLQKGFHNLMAPNEATLRAFGWTLTREKRLSNAWSAQNGDRSQSYVDRICESADAVFQARITLLDGKPAALIRNRYILAVSSIYWGHFLGWREKAKQLTDKKQSRQLHLALARAIQAKTYYDTHEVDGDGRASVSAIDYAFMKERAKDMSSFTAALSMLATSTMTPVLRLEPRLNEVRGDLKILCHCVRGEVPRRHNWKVSRLTRALGAKLRSLVNPEFLKRIDSPELDGEIEGIQLVSDVPLELMPTRGLALGLRFDTSRISPMPGNLFWQKCMLAPIQLSLDAFKEVLVVRSFKESDPLRRMFETAVGVMNKAGGIKNVKYRFVDVNSRQEFVSAINGCSGAILVFDGHGTFDKNLGVGALVVGGEALDTWSLREMCRFPPIVMFSACDTQPLDGSHGSVATAAFALGARAVLATSLPIYGDKAAVFNARMLLRLDQFLPVAVEMRPLLTWREIVSGMIRMAHTREILDSVNDFGRLKIDREALDKAQLVANEAINERRSDWYELFVEKFSEVAGLEFAEMQNLIETHAGLTDAMKYIQLGHPERIAILTEHPAQTFEREMNVAA